MTSAIAPLERSTPQPIAAKGPPSRHGMAQLVVLPPAGADAAPSLGLVRSTPNGFVKAIRTELHLSRQAGHVYELRGETNITAAGYDYINQALGVTFFYPETTTGEDGKPHCNPYVFRDKYDVIKRIKLQAIGFGRNAVGNWTGIASTLYYDLEPCFAQDVLKKWRPKSGVTRDWGILYSAENVPEKVSGDPHRKCINVPGGYVLACEFRGEFLDVVSDHAHRVRFATRIAETIVKRRILMAFTGRRKPTVNKDRSLTVSIISWQQADREHIEQLVKQVQSIRSGQLRLDGESIEMQQESATVDHEMESEVIGEETAEADGAAPGTAEPAPDSEAPDDESLATHLDTLRARARELMDALPAEASSEALAAAGFENREDLAKCTTPGFLDGVIEALERKRLEAAQKNAAPVKAATTAPAKAPAKSKKAPTGKLFDDHKTQHSP